MSIEVLARYVSYSCLISSCVIGDNYHERSFQFEITNSWKVLASLVEVYGRTQGWDGMAGSICLLVINAKLC